MPERTSRLIPLLSLPLFLLLPQTSQSGTLVGHPPGFCTQQLNTFTADLIGTAFTTSGPVTITLTNADLLWNPDGSPPEPSP